MSGICGLFQLDQAPVAEEALATMTAVLRHRGPDGLGTTLDGPVGLVHTLLATTPESEHEPQPFQHAESGCVIVADVRLDYRDELIDSLELDARRAYGDAELILRAFLAWADGCVDRLEGDFAFALWDPRNQRLFCARDRFGMRPFYYHFVSTKRFAFASDARAIVALPEVPGTVNEGRIADFLVPELEWVDYTSTFYKDVSRLPPAHTLTVTASGIHVSEYWVPQPGPGLALTSDGEYVEGFLDVFSRAITERLRVPEARFGCMLSGGMDSGSIVAVTGGLVRQQGDRSLQIYSLAHPRGADCNESRRIYSTLDHIGLPGTQILVDDPNRHVATLVSRLEEPFDGTMLFSRAIYRSARQDGNAVVLDGGSGDIVFNECRYISRLLQRGHLIRAWREIAGEARFYEMSSGLPNLLRHMRAGLVPEAVKKLMRPSRQRRDASRFVRNSLINKEFAKSIDLEMRFEQLWETFSGTASGDPGIERARKIRPNLTAGRERYARVAASEAVEARDPFADKRVVDFCTRVPDHLIMRDGWPKFLPRIAMAGHLPDEVRWGRGKPHIGHLFNRRFLQQEQSLGRLSLAHLREALGGYVDASALRTAWRVFEAGGNSDPVSSAYILSIWLAKPEKIPVVDD